MNNDRINLYLGDCCMGLRAFRPLGCLGGNKLPKKMCLHIASRYCVFVLSIHFDFALNKCWSFIMSRTLREFIFYFLLFSVFLKAMF